MTTPRPTPFQADFDAKPFDEQVSCLRRWASDPASHRRYYTALRWLFDRDQIDSGQFICQFVGQFADPTGGFVVPTASRNPSCQQMFDFDPHSLGRSLRHFP